VSAKHSTCRPDPLLFFAFSTPHADRATMADPITSRSRRGVRS
jgi:hypothetical protein